MLGSLAMKRRERAETEDDERSPKNMFVTIIFFLRVVVYSQQN